MEENMKALYKWAMISGACGDPAGRELAVILYQHSAGTKSTNHRTQALLTAVEHAMRTKTGASLRPLNRVLKQEYLGIVSWAHGVLTSHPGDVSIVWNQGKLTVEITDSIFAWIISDLLK
jgi:hypothetical protein